MLLLNVNVAVNVAVAVAVTDALQFNNLINYLNKLVMPVNYAFLMIRVYNEGKHINAKQL